MCLCDVDEFVWCEWIFLMKMFCLMWMYLFDVDGCVCCERVWVRCWEFVVDLIRRAYILLWTCFVVTLFCRDFVVSVVLLWLCCVITKESKRHNKQVGYFSVVCCDFYWPSELFYMLNDFLFFVDPSRGRDIWTWSTICLNKHCRSNQCTREPSSSPHSTE